MKIFRIVLLALFILVSVIFLILQFLTPSVVANYVEKHSKEWIGRKVKIGSLSWNLPELKFTLKDVWMLDSNDAEKFVGFDYLRLDLSTPALLKLDVRLEELTIEGLGATVEKNGEHFNFDDLLARFVPPDTAKAAEPKDPNAPLYSDPVPKDLPVGLYLGNIKLSGVHATYKDLGEGYEFAVQNTSVEIPKVHLDSTKTEVLAHTEFPTGGEVDATVLFGIATGEFEAEAQVKDLMLEIAQAIAVKFVAIDSIQGRVGVKVQAKGTLNDVMASEASGTVTLDDFKIVETAGGHYSLEHFGTGFTGVNLSENKIPVDYVTVQGVAAHLDLLKSGKTNLELLLAPMEKMQKEAKAAEKEEAKESPAETAEVAEGSEGAGNAKAGGKPLQVSLKKLDVSEVSATLNDYTVTKPMHYTVSHITVESSDVTMDALDVKVTAHFQESGSMTLLFKGNPNDLTTMSVAVDISKMALRPFSNYSLHYTAYPLISGTLNLHSRTNVVSNNLKSKNAVKIVNINVGDKNKAIDPQYTVPMKVGLYILKDRKGVIDIDMPLEGRLDDPQFSIGRLIWNTFCNLMVKVALSPTKLVTDAFVSDKPEVDAPTEHTEAAANSTKGQEEEAPAAEAAQAAEPTAAAPAPAPEPAAQAAEAAPAPAPAEAPAPEPAPAAEAAPAP